MSVRITWEQLLNPQRLPSNDLIRLTILPGYNAISSNVQFRLHTAPRVTWEKRLRFFDARGEISFLVTKDNIHTAGPASFDLTRLTSGGVRVELVKAMTFGTLTGVYELTDFGRWKGRTLTFEWLED